MNISDCFCTVQ